MCFVGSANFFLIQLRVTVYDMCQKEIVPFILFECRKDWLKCYRKSSQSQNVRHFVISVHSVQMFRSALWRSTSCQSWKLSVTDNSQLPSRQRWLSMAPNEELLLSCSRKARSIGVVVKSGTHWGQDVIAILATYILAFHFPVFLALQISSADNFFSPRNSFTILCVLNGL